MISVVPTAKFHPLWGCTLDVCEGISFKRGSPVAKAPGAHAENRFNTSVNHMDKTMKEVYNSVIARDPNQPEFHQAVEEVLDSLGPVIEAHPEYLPVVRSMVEAERIIQFRVPWYDDEVHLHHHTMEHGIE